LGYAHERGWVVVTHDSDFGSLSTAMGEPYTGIVFLRPGHIVPSFVLQGVDVLEAFPLEVSPPFLAVAERRGRVVRVRVRSSREAEL
jgi:hypothetical protein